MAKPVPAAEAAIRTATVTISSLTVDSRQMPRSVFRQLPHSPVLRLDMGDECIQGEPWGYVNYFWKDCGRYEPRGVLHVVWTEDGTMYRSLVSPVHEATHNLFADPTEALSGDPMAAEWITGGGTPFRDMNGHYCCLFPGPVSHDVRQCVKSWNRGWSRLLLLPQLYIAF